MRSLCAMHGWEFEWLSEDGERKRRIGERARKEKADAEAKDKERPRAQAAEAATAAEVPDGFAKLPKREKAT